MNREKDPLADGLNSLFRAIGRGLKNAFYGARRLTRPLPIAGLVICLLIAFLAYRMRLSILSLEQLGSVELPVPIRYILLWLLALLPLLYLMILGAARQNKTGVYDEIFAEIAFRGKDGKPPMLISERKQNNQSILVFQSNIPLREWKKAKEQLETGFDCSIRKIEPGRSKKTVELVTVPSDFQIPEVIRWRDEFIDRNDGVLVIGESDLERVSFDLNRTPHVLAAGETGSGKSVTLRCMLWQMIYKGCRVYMIDFKGGVEFGLEYEEYGEVVVDRQRALELLQLLVKENELRLALFRQLRVKNLKEYNDKTGSNLCRIGLFIDEIAEMLDKKGAAKEDKAIYEQLEGALSTLARLSRATGINLFLGVQRPDANVLTGQIKNNVPVRISGRFADKSASEIVLGNTTAADIPDIKGRFLYKVGNETTEFQSYWFKDEEDLQAVDAQPGEMLLDGPKYIPPSAPARPARPSAEPQAPDGLDFNFEEDFSCE